jgi:V8-like Glu-specific endopeptidase
MKIRALTCALLALCSVHALGAPGDTALTEASFVSMVGGQPVPASSRFARLTVMIVAKFGDKVGLCSGTLISRDTVLSAGHCVKSEETGLPATEIVVALNPTGGIKPANVIRVTKFRSHPGYHNIRDGMVANRPVHDISVLHLDRPAMGPDVLIADLPTAELAPDTNVVLAGYGRTDPTDSKSSGKLYFAWTSASAFHVGFGADADTEIRLTGIQPCSGDSGGPIFRATETSAVLVGVTSNVMNACTENGTEMSVAAHLPWIRATAAFFGGTVGH